MPQRPGHYTLRESAMRLPLRLSGSPATDLVLEVGSTVRRSSSGIRSSFSSPLTSSSNLVISPCATSPSNMSIMPPCLSLNPLPTSSSSFPAARHCALLSRFLRSGRPETGLTLLRYELRFELLHSTLSLVDKPTDVARHSGKLLGSEEHQEEQPYDHQLLKTDSEHRSLRLPFVPGVCVS